MSGNNNEKIFKLLGWEPVEHALYGIVGWKTPEGKTVDDTPLATGDWEVCRERIIPALRKKGYEYHIPKIHREFWWRDYKGHGEFVEIKADNLPAALVASAIKVLEKEKKNVIRRGRVSKVNP